MEGPSPPQRRPSLSAADRRPALAAAPLPRRAARGGGEYPSSEEEEPLSERAEAGADTGAEKGAKAVVGASHARGAGCDGEAMPCEASAADTAEAAAAAAAAAAIVPALSLSPPGESAPDRDGRRWRRRCCWGEALAERGVRPRRLRWAVRGGDALTRPSRLELCRVPAKPLRPLRLG